MVKKIATYRIFVMSEETYHLRFLGGGGICSSCPRTHVHAHTQKPGSLSLFSGTFTKKNLKLTELNK